MILFISEKNEKKAQELKKEQQLLKKRNKKVRKDGSDTIKSAESIENGHLNDSGQEFSKEEMEDGNFDDNHKNNTSNEKIHNSVSLKTVSNKKLMTTGSKGD